MTIIVSQTFITSKVCEMARALINLFFCNAIVKCSLFPFFLSAIRCGGGEGGFSGSGSGSNSICAAWRSGGLGQMISGTGWVRASVLSLCRPLV